MVKHLFLGCCPTTNHSYKARHPTNPIGDQSGRALRLKHTHLTTTTTKQAATALGCFISFAALLFSPLRSSSPLSAPLLFLGLRLQLQCSRSR
jgi:hypothetical protein